jgi:uncharacterized repeat protein (TIGR01451 family)
MRIGAMAVKALAVASLFLAHEAQALTADGVLLTNLAWATFRITNGTGQNITYGATANVVVATPNVQLKKTTSATLQVAGGLVTFCLSFSNTSGLTSAVNVAITDKLPDNMKFSDPTGTASFDNDPEGGVMNASFSLTGTAPFTAGMPTSGQAGPLYFRWTVNILGPHESAYMCYTASII